MSLQEAEQEEVFAAVMAAVGRVATVDAVVAGEAGSQVKVLEQTLQL